MAPADHDAEVEELGHDLQFEIRPDVGRADELDLNVDGAALRDQRPHERGVGDEDAVEEVVESLEEQAVLIDALSARPVGALPDARLRLAV